MIIQKKNKGTNESVILAAICVSARIPNQAKTPKHMASFCSHKIKAKTGAQKGSPDCVSSVFLNRSWSHQEGGSQNSHSERKTFQKNPGVTAS